MVDKSFSKDFQYRHKNPYHVRLESFSHFVLRDHEGEKNQGLWNQKVFNRQAPLQLEIGSGYGHFMTQHCQDNPNINFIGLDYRFKRSFQLAKKLEKHPYKNFRVLRAKGERLEFLFAPQELSHIFYFFPDPWPKTKHHKKRLFQKSFLESVHKVLKSDGKFYIKTDHDDLADWMQNELEKSGLFEIQFFSQDLHQEFPSHFLAQQITKFEKIFLAQDVKIKAFVLIPRKLKNQT